MFVFIELFGKAYNRIASIDKAVNGFKATGIYPIDRNVFNDSEFIVNHQADPQIVFDAYVPITEGTLVATDNLIVTCTVNEERNTSLIMKQHYNENANKESINLNENEHTYQNKVAETNKEAAFVKNFEEHLMELCPSPTNLPSSSLQNNSREKQHSEILTSSSIKKMLEIKKEKKEEKVKHVEQVSIKKELQKKIKLEKDEERLKKRDLKMKIKVEKIEDICLKRELRAKKKVEKEEEIRKKGR